MRRSGEVWERDVGGAGSGKAKRGVRAGSERPGPRGEAPGVPDGLDRLWTPHRLAYVKGDDEPRAGYHTPAGCPFCRAPNVAEDEGLVVARGDSVYAVLNLY